MSENIFFFILVIYPEGYMQYFAHEKSSITICEGVKKINFLKLKSTV